MAAKKSGPMDKMALQERHNEYDLFSFLLKSQNNFQL